MSSGTPANARKPAADEGAEQPGELSDATTHDLPGSPAPPRAGLRARQPGAPANGLPPRPADRNTAFYDSWASLGQQNADHLLPAGGLARYAHPDQPLLGLPSGPAGGEWTTPMLTDEWLLDGVAALPDAWDGTLPGSYGSNASMATATHPSYGQQPPQDEDMQGSPQPQRGGGRRGGRGGRRCLDPQTTKDKNREAQRRFRDRQRERLSTLEDQLEELRGVREQALAGEQRHRQEQAAMARRLIALQADVSLLHAREVCIGELAGEVAALRAGDGKDRGAALDDLALALVELQGGGVEGAAQFCVAKLCLFVSPDDLYETDAQLALSLRGASYASAGGVAPSRLKLRLRLHGGERVYSFAQLMHLPPQAFVGIHDSYAEAIKTAVDAGSSDTEQLASELRAALCCFAAIHPQQSMLLQLREGGGPAVRSNALSQRLQRELLGVLHLSLAQLQRMRQAALTFHRQQAHLQDERQGLLQAAAVPLGLFPGGGPAHMAAALDAEARLRRNLDLDLFNASRLASHFLTDVLTTRQYAQLLAASHPHPLNLTDLVHHLDAALPTSAGQGA